MTSPLNLRFGNVHLTSGAGGDATEIPPDTPFRLLVCGNLSGNRDNLIASNQRKPIFIDRDNFDEILARLSPSVTLPNSDAGMELTISFRELNDFHPDGLFRSLPVFDKLRTLQTEIGNPATFQQAAAKIRTWAKLPDVAPTTVQPQNIATPGILEEILLNTKQTQASGRSDWQRFLRDIVEPHLVEKADPNQKEYALVVEHAIGAQMRTILHDPTFQSLEAAWRSVFLLVQRLPTDASLQIFVLDTSVDEMRADLAQNDPRDSVFVRAVIEGAADKPWASVVSLELFGNAIADLELLASMAMVSSRTRTPILAGAVPALVGCPSLAASPDPRSWKPDPAIAAAWEMIQGMDVSRFLGLVAPRFLLRLPYGKDAAETESFHFEEMPTPDHESYLWGSGAVLCGVWLAEAFVASGWQLNLDERTEINGLPVHIYRDEGEAHMKPCAEVFLRDAALECLMDHGLMVVTSLPNRDGVRLARFQSAAKEPQQLAGRW